jgi:tRNA threonylcarbamoyladenosine biosynthesis protein TsaE
MRIVTGSPEETIALGRAVGALLKKGDIVAYSGDLGAGKTTMTRGIVQGLGMEDEVTSPTFAIVNEYEGRINVYHFDMYRISSESELWTTGFYDYPLEESIFLVEWTENIRDCIPETAVFIDIKYLGEDSREILIRGDDRFDDISY